MADASAVTLRVRRLPHGGGLPLPRVASSGSAHGMLEVRGRFTPEQAARFIAAVESARTRGQSSRDDCMAEGSPGEPATPTPSFPAARADALMELIEGENPDIEIIVHVSAETLRDDGAAGCCRFEDGASLPPETARRLACDAGVVRLIEAPDGQPAGPRAQDALDSTRAAPRTHRARRRLPLPRL